MCFEKLQISIQQEEISIEEANSIILTEYRVMIEREMNSIYPKVPNAQFIRIAHLYTKLYVLINHCFDICGLHGLTVKVICILYIQYCIYRMISGHCPKRKSGVSWTNANHFCSRNFGNSTKSFKYFF